MRLTSLTMKGFRAYRSETTIDLANLGGAVIRGENGSGKSSIPEAIEWALFGTSRSSGANRVVTIGETECLVELGFAVGPTQYLMRRLRSLKGRGSTAVHLFEQNGSGDVPRDPKTIETIIGVDREALLASAIIRQGKASRFTKAKATERRQLLKQLAGLDRYDELAKEAKDRRTEISMEFDRVAARCVDLGAVQAERETWVAILGEAEGKAGKLAEIAEVAEANLKAAQEVHAGLLAQVAAQAARVEERQRLLSDGMALRAKAKNLRKELDRLNAFDLSRFDSALEALEKWVAEVDSVSSKVQAARAAEQAIADTEADDRELRARYRAAAGTKDNPPALAGLKSKQARREALGASTAVLDKVPCKGSDLACSCPLLANALASVPEIAQLDAEITALTSQAEEERAEARAELDEIAEAGKANKVKLDDLRAQLDADGGFAMHHTALLGAQQHQAKAQALMTEKTEVEAQVALLEHHQASLAEITEEIEAKGALVDAIQIVDGLDDLEHDAGDQVTECVDTRRLAQTKTDAAKAKMTEARARIDAIAAATEGLEDAQKTKAELGAADKRWDATTHALRLAPILVLENLSIPILEREANRVLSRIGDGMSIRLDTQRALQSGKQAETLDLAVQTEIGELLYEDLSGGQQFRVDVAFCLAQSALLCEREGVPISWLVLDEGWGALDGAGRDSLKDVITSLQQMYDLLLVITHVDDVGECLPAQIMIEPGPDGARVVYR